MKLTRYSLNIFLTLIFLLLMACSGSDNISPPTNSLTETAYQVNLIGQTAVPAKISKSSETNRLRSTRQWIYTVDWNVNAYIAQNDTIAFLRIENGISTVLGTLQVAYHSSGDTHFVSLLRQGGSLSMNDLDLTITSATSPVSLTLTLNSSGENSRIYQFTQNSFNPKALQHRLTLSNLDVLTAEAVQVQYVPQGSSVLEIAERLQAVLVRDDEISIEKIGSPDNTALTRTLEQHLNTFFTVLFSDTDTPHEFTLEVQGQYQLAPSGQTVSIPLILIPPTGSGDLNTLIPGVATSLKTQINSSGAPFNQLQLNVNVWANNGRTPLLNLTNVIVDMKQVSDV